MTVDQQTLRKSIDIRAMLRHVDRLSDPGFWRELVPGARVSDEPFGSFATDRAPVTPAMIEAWRSQLGEDAYFQTAPLVAEDRRSEMLRCIDAVVAAGLPATFALVYDVFFEVFADLHVMLQGVLGPGYTIIPNFWLYYIEPSDEAHGFEPHRDGEYADTIADDGLPTVLTVWVALSDATPLNSCMYVVPAGRDPGYASAIHSLHQDAAGIRLEDIRSLPAAAGTVSCWTQYIYHWGSRSSHRAPAPRVSYAVYCQRGDVEPVESVSLEVPSPLSFQARLAYACRGLHRYSYLALRDAAGAGPVLEFLTQNMAGPARPAPPGL